MARNDVDSSEAEVLAELRHHWGFDPDERIVVIGNIRSPILPDGRTIHFLDGSAPAPIAHAAE